MRSFGEMEASPSTGDSGAHLVDTGLPQTPASSSVPLSREPTVRSPLMTSLLSPRENSQRSESDDELIAKGRSVVGEMIEEIVKRDSSSMRRCRDRAGSLTADELRKYGESPRDSRGAIAVMHFARWTSENVESDSTRVLESRPHVRTISEPSHVTMRSKSRKSRKRMSHGLGSVSEDGSARSRESQHESSRSSKSEGRRREGRKSTKRRGEQRGESENASMHNRDLGSRGSLNSLDSSVREPNSKGSLISALSDGTPGYFADGSYDLSRRSSRMSRLSETSTVRRFDLRLNGFQEEMRLLVRQSLEEQGSMVRQSLEAQGSIVSEAVQTVRQDMEDTIRVQEQVLQHQCDELLALRERVDGVLTQDDSKPVHGVGPNDGSEQPNGQNQQIKSNPNRSSKPENMEALLPAEE